MARIAIDRIGPIAALRELIDALTAVGNYLIAADRLFDGNPARKQEKRLGEALGRPQLPLHDAPRLWRMEWSRKIDGGAEIEAVEPQSPKCPLAMCMPTNPWQLPFVGRALKSQGQPKALSS